MDDIKICKRQGEILIEKDIIDNIVQEKEDFEDNVVVCDESSNVCNHPLGDSSSDNEQECN